MALQAQIDFYMSLAKPLAISLNNTDCRARACAWLKFLQDCEDSQLKVDYVKLLIFVMQKNNLLGPFSEAPPTNGILQAFPDDSSLSKMILRVNEKASGDGGAGDSQPEVKEYVSADLKQFVALQTLPGDQGIQCFMAIGTDEMNKWEQTTSSSCSCNNLTQTSDRMPPATGHLQPPDPFGYAFPPRYSPMIRYQRQRRRMDQMPVLPQSPTPYESNWIPTKEEVYWLKKMNKMIRRPGGPDTNFMSPVKRYYAQADRSQTTDEDWDPYQAQEEGGEEFFPGTSSSPRVDQQFAANQDEFAEDWDEFRGYQQPLVPVSPPPAGNWNNAAYQGPNTSYQSNIMDRSVPPMESTFPPRGYDTSQSHQSNIMDRSVPPMENTFPPRGYDTSQSFYEDSAMQPMASPRTGSPPKPAWAKKVIDPDCSGPSDKYYSTAYDTSKSQYQTANSTFNDSHFPQPQSPSAYKYPSSSTPQRQSPVSSRGPQTPVQFRRTAVSQDLDADPSRIVVFHCQCQCKKP